VQLFVPPRLGDAPSFYRSRGGNLQLYRVVLITCGGVAYSVVELMVVVANLAPVGCHGVSCSQERLRGWLCGNFPFGRRPYADLRVWLAEGREVHSRGRGNVLSLGFPRRRGWLHKARDGCTAAGMVEQVQR
jgi:hypothetical protein